MKFHLPTNMGEPAGVCCRQSPLVGAVGGLVVAAAFVGAAVLCQQSGFHWLVWGGCAALAAVIVPLLAWDVVAKFRAGNWLVRIAPDGLWINLRSYLNVHLPEAATVVHLPNEEIVRAQRHTQTWSTPGARGGTGATLWWRESLELQLAPGDAEAIRRALAEERGRKSGTAGFTIKGRQQSVTVPREGVVRIAWRGHGHHVTPGLARALEELGRHVEVAEPTRADRPDWRQLSDAELDELVAQLVGDGDTLEATELLVRRRGISTTEAQQTVDELERRI